MEEWREEMATIKDIAEMAGVSITTVSRILNNDSSLSTTMETKQKVIDAAKKLNYKKVGRSTKATFRLGIVQWFSAEQELQDTYYLSVRNGIEDFCIKNCIQIVRAFKTDVNYMDYLENINGLICIGKFSKKEVKELKRISKNIVFLDMPVADYSVTSFTLDFEYAVNKAMSYLTKLGHTKIGFLGGREILDTDEVFDDERIKEYVKYCSEHGLDYDKYLKEGQYSIESGYSMMSEFIQSKDMPTAVFAASDYIAFGAMKAIKEIGLKIPEDISVIGFDDAQICNYTTPTLTTIHAPAYDMGQYGANFLFGATNCSITTPLNVKMPCELVERESCGPVKNKESR